MRRPRPRPTASGTSWGRVTETFNAFRHLPLVPLAGGVTDGKSTEVNGRKPGAVEYEIKRQGAYGLSDARRFAIRSSTSAHSRKDVSLDRP